MISIMSAYVSPADRVYDHLTIYSPGETIRYNILHRMSPHVVNAQYRIYGHVERLHHHGIANDELRLDMIWRQGRVFTYDGHYNHPSLLTTVGFSAIPADPDDAFLTSINAIRRRSTSFTGMVTGQHFLDVSPGYWRFTAYVGLINSDQDFTEVAASWPYYYVINHP